MTNMIPGFAHIPEYASDFNLDHLVEQITWEQPTIKMFGKNVQVPRLTSWMGDGAYTYSGIHHPAADMPHVVETLRERLEATAGSKFNSVLANLYRNGSDSVAWHADDEPELGHQPIIASISIGATRAFHVKPRNGGERATFNLAHGDLIVMSGRSQLDYLHAVPKTVKPVGARINLTFRLVTL